MKLRRKVIGVLLGVVFTHAASANHSCPGVITINRRHPLK